MHRHSLALVILLALGFLPSAAAQESTSTPGQNGRFTFTPVADGQLRLDTHTGQVSLCQRKPDAWTCEAVADDRAAYEKEIGRLRDRTVELETALKRDGKSSLQLPSNAEIDRAMNFFEKMFRRFLGMIENLRRESEPGRS